MMGGLILGMPGPWAEDYREASDHYTTKMGGLPDWPVPETDIAPDLLKCRVCSERLSLVAQVYAPISLPELTIEERVIYVLGCLNPNCGKDPKSWRVLRVQKCREEMLTESISPKATAWEESSAPTLKTSNWNEDGLSINVSGEENSDSDSDLDLEELARSLSEAASTASQLKKQNGSTHSIVARKGAVTKPRASNDTIPVVPCFYIWPEKETPRGDISSTCANSSSLSIKEDHAPSDNEDAETWEPEDYEYDKALNADRTYLKFKKRMDSRPEQCFRYSFGGNPLFATTDLVKLDTCRICGSLRHFEIQLMSPLLYFLHEAADGSKTFSAEGWSWMTLIVYTCPRSCCVSRCKGKSSSCCWTVVEEAIIIQDE